MTRHVVIARDTQGGPVGAGNAVRYEGRVPHVAGRATTSFGRDTVINQGIDPDSGGRCGPVPSEFNYAGRYGAIYGLDAFARVKGWLGIFQNCLRRPTRFNSPRTITASGNRLSLPIEPRQKPGSGFANRFAPSGVWVRHHDEQSNTGRMPRSWKSKPGTRKCQT